MSFPPSIGLDLAKNVFQIQGVDGSGEDAVLIGGDDSMPPKATPVPVLALCGIPYGSYPSATGLPSPSVLFLEVGPRKREDC